MKLELKHIAPYLPYGLKVQASWSIDGFGGLCTSKAIGLYRDELLLEPYTILHKHIPYRISIDRTSLSDPDTKPLLLPMSSLYTEIDGKVGIVEIAKKHIEYDEKKGDYDFKLDSCFARQIRLDITWRHTAYSEPLYGDHLFIQTQRTHLNLYWVNEYLFSHHFDVFSLINKGLAIDKTKIK